MQGDHFDGGRGGFVAFIAELAAGAVEGLLLVVRGQHAESDGHVPAELHLLYAHGDALAYEVEVAGVALDDAAEHDDGIDVGVFGEVLGAHGEFESTGHPFDADLFVGAAGGVQGGDGAFEQGAGDGMVPFRHDDTERHFGGRGYGPVENGEVFQIRGH